MDGFHQVVGGEAGVLDLRHLWPPSSTILWSPTMKPFLTAKIVKLGAGVGVRDGNLDGFHVEFLGKVDRTTNRLVRFRRGGEDEVAVNG